MSGVAKPWSTSGGVTAVTRSAAALFAQRLVQSETYRLSLEERIKTQTLPPAVECMLWHYAFGKPKEEVQVNVSSDLSSLSVEELMQRVGALAEQLREAKALEDALPGEVVQGPWPPQQP